MNHFRIFFFIYFFLGHFFIISKTILLTGGAGFIGSHVAKRFLARGYFVVVVDNFNDAYPLIFKKNNLSLVKQSDITDRLTVYEADICDVEMMDKIFSLEKPDYICHLAARAGVRESIKNSYEYVRTNVLGTNVIFEMAHKYNIEHVVAASSSTVYGASSSGAFIEDSFINTQSSPYGVTKRTGELLAYVYHYLYGISITNLRFFSVYGPHSRMDMAPLIFMDALYHNKPIVIFGDGSVVRDFTYIDDIVDGIVSAIDRPMGYQIINLGRGEPVMLSDFIAIMEQIVGKSATIVYSSSFAADTPRTHADINKAQLLLGYDPSVSLIDGLASMYRWYKEDYLRLKEYTLKRDFCNESEVAFYDVVME